MKFLIAFTCLILAVHGLDKDMVEEIKAKMCKMAESCAAEVGAGPDDLAALKAKKMPTTHEGKCIIFCMHKHFGAQNDDGSLNLQGALDSLEMVKELDEKLHASMATIFKKCGADAPKDGDPCLYAANLATCIVAESKAMNVMDDVIME